MYLPSPAAQLMMSQNVSAVSLSEFPPRDYEPDSQLPAWARRSNPIIMRHLGSSWRTIPPDTSILVKLFLVQVGIILVSFFAPFVLHLLMLAITASLVYLPFGVFSYLRTLLHVGTDSVNYIVEEQQADTLDTLRTTPYSLKEIFQSKIAASIWKQAEGLDLIWMAGMLLSLPVILIEYVLVWPADQPLELVRLASLVALIVSVLRLIVEPMMIGAVSIAVGVMLPHRVTATASTGIVVVFYFLLINLPRFLPMSFPVRMILEVILPLALPVLLTWGSLELADRLLRG